MSYSDYGSYNWQKINGEWIYKPEFEDRTLISKQQERVLERQTGLKLDAVLQSQENEKNHPELPFYMTHSQHSVIGDSKHYAVVSYKGEPKVLWKGTPIDSIEDKDVDREGFTHKTINRSENGCRVLVMIDEEINYWSISYVKNLEEEFLGICGYGLGDHWWLDSEGNKTTKDNYPGELLKWPREKECLQRCLSKLNKQFPGWDKVEK